MVASCTTLFHIFVGYWRRVAKSITAASTENLTNDLSTLHPVLVKD